MIISPPGSSSERDAFNIAIDSDRALAGSPTSARMAAPAGILSRYAHRTRSMAMECQRRLPAVAVSIALAVGGALAPTPAKPAPQDTTTGSGVKDDSDGDNNGSDLTRPQNSFDARFEVRTSTGASSSGATTQTVRDTELFRLSSRIELNADWKLGVLAQVPVLAKTTTTENSSSSPDYEFGLGNAVFQTIFVRKIDERWAFGFGARLVAPTAEDNLGSGKWEIMPGFGARYELSPNFGDGRGQAAAA